MPDLVGQILDGRYRVDAPLGEGAMGSVYRGERLKLGRQVAIKVLNRDFGSSRQRFEREAEAMAKLEHPNCASVLDVGVHGDQPYVVMEFVGGRNLAELMAEGLLPIARAVEITRQVLSGLSHAHDNGVIHRDIKPANIVIAQKAGVGDLVKILDFGLARFRTQSSNLTGAMVVGTPHYMAPEQVRGGDDLDHRVDLYACGVLLFELLTGTKPFEAAEPMAVCMQHVTVDPPRLSERAPGRTFGALEDVVARALEKEREQRYQSAEAFAKDLVAAAAKLDETIVGIPQLDAASEDAPPRRRSRVPIAIAGALAIGGIAAAGYFALDRADRPPAPIAAVEKKVESPPARKTEPADRPVAPKEPPPRPPPPKEPPPAPADPVKKIVDGALAKAAQGRRDAAIDALVDARKTYPNDARLPYHASKLYLDKLWKAEGLKHARAAIALDKRYRSDADLIKHVVKLFNTTKGVDFALASFLRKDIGPPAKPFLQDTAKNHPNPIVRKRAAAELKQRAYR